MWPQCFTRNAIDAASNEQCKFENSQRVSILAAVASDNPSGDDKEDENEEVDILDSIKYEKSASIVCLSNLLTRERKKICQPALLLVLSVTLAADNEILLSTRKRRSVRPVLRFGIGGIMIYVHKKYKRKMNVVIPIVLGRVRYRLVRNNSK